MAVILWEIFLLLGLILVTGFFVMAEMALVSVRRTRLQQRAENGDRSAKIAFDLTLDKNTFLATIQVAITMLGVFTAAFGGSTISRDLEAYVIEHFESLKVYQQWVSYGILTTVVVTLTFFTLLLGELIPKRIALVYAEPIAVAVARFMKWLARIFSPTVKLFGFCTDLFFGFFKLRKEAEAIITEEEIKDAIEEGAQAGVIEEAEQDMALNILKMGDRTVGSIMTPRPDIVFLDLKEESSYNWKEIAESDHSQFPVIDGDLDNVVGTISIKNIWSRMVTGQPVDIKALMISPLFVPESARILVLLELFKQHHRHTAMVTDEFGNIQGVVNQIDVLEAIVGFIPTVDEKAEELFIKRADGSWLIDAMVGIEEFKDRFELPTLKSEDRSDFTTIGGYLMANLGRIPKAGDYFQDKNFRLEVVDMDGRRVDKVLFSQVIVNPLDNKQD
jgi:putative hemolysin